MTVTNKAYGDAYICELTGRIDSSNAAEFEEALTGIPMDGKLLILDMEALEFISSAGLRVILKRFKTGGNGKKIECIHMNGVVEETFRVSGFDKLLSAEE